MKEILKVLRIDLDIKNENRLYLKFVKILYVIYTLPFVMFSYGLSLRSLGAFENANSDKISSFDRVMIHFLAIFLSYLLWFFIFALIEGATGFKNFVPRISL